MLIFKNYSGEKREWDEFLKQNKFYDVRHSFCYYQYLKALNQKHIFPYLVFKNEVKNENLIGQFIVKIKKFFIFNIIYIYCGPTNIESYFDDFKPKNILENLGTSKGISYIRFKTFLPEDEIQLRNIEINNWNRPQNSEENLFLNLTSKISVLKKNLTRNWRHNFYRSKKNILETKIIHYGENQKIYKLYLEMSKIKKIKMPFTQSSLKNFLIFLKKIL